MLNRNKKGFTIVELVIVIAVIAVLAAVLIPTFAGIIKKANESAYLQERTNQMMADLAEKITNEDYYTWEDFESKIADELAKLEAENEENGLSPDEIQKAIENAIAEYEAKLKDGDTGLTEEQIKAIIEKALEGSLTISQVQSIVNAAIGKLDFNTNNVPPEVVQQIINDAIKDLQNSGKEIGISKEDIQAAIDKAIEDAKLPQDAGMTPDQLQAAIDKAVEDALANFTTGGLTAAEIEKIINDALSKLNGSTGGNNGGGSTDTGGSTEPGDSTVDYALSIDLENFNTTLTAGSYTALPNVSLAVNGTDDPTASFTWTSNNPAVVFITGGYLAAVSAGTAKITVTSNPGAISDSFTVVVTATESGGGNSGTEDDDNTGTEPPIEEACSHSTTRATHNGNGKYPDFYGTTHTVVCAECSETINGSEDHQYVDGICSKCSAPKIYTYTCASACGFSASVKIVSNVAYYYNVTTQTWDKLATHEKDGMDCSDHYDCPNINGNLPCIGCFMDSNPCNHVMTYSQISSINSKNHYETCSLCGETFTMPHELKQGTCACGYHECIKTNFVDLGNNSHSWTCGSPTCSKTGTDKHSAAGGAIGYTSDKDNHYAECKNCHASFAEAHAFYNDKCSTCLYEKCEHTLEDGGLEWVTTDSTHALKCKTCLVNGKTLYIIRETAHSYEDGVCLCGQPEGCAHTTLDGNYRCTVCTNETAKYYVYAVSSEEELALALSKCITGTDITNKIYVTKDFEIKNPITSASVRCVELYLNNHTITYTGTKVFWATHNNSEYISIIGGTFKAEYITNTSFITLSRKSQLTLDNVKLVVKCNSTTVNDFSVLSAKNKVQITVKNNSVITGESLGTGMRFVAYTESNGTKLAIENSTLSITSNGNDRNYLAYYGASCFATDTVSIKGTTKFNGSDITNSTASGYMTFAGTAPTFVSN